MRQRIMDNLLLPNYPRVVRLFSQLPGHQSSARASLIANTFCEYQFWLKKTLGHPPKKVPKELHAARDEGKAEHKRLEDEAAVRSKPEREQVEHLGEVKERQALKQLKREVIKELEEEVYEELKVELKREPTKAELKERKPSKRKVQRRLSKAHKAEIMAAEKEDYRKLGIDVEGIESVPERVVKLWANARAEEDAFYGLHSLDPLKTYCVRERDPTKDGKGTTYLHSPTLKLTGHPDEIQFTPEAIVIVDDKPLKEGLIVYNSYKLQIGCYALLFREMFQAFHDPRPVKIAIRPRGSLTGSFLWEGKFASALEASVVRHIERWKVLMSTSNPADFYTADYPTKCDACEWGGPNGQSNGCDRRSIFKDGMVWVR